MRRLFLTQFLLTFLLPALPAQGDPGTVPASLRAAFGNTRLSGPLAGAPTRYQQCFLASELPAARTMVGLGLRQDNLSSGWPGRVVQLDLWLGYTSFDLTTLTSVFAANFASSPARVEVLPRTYVRLPGMPTQLPSDPAVFLVRIPFRVPFVWANQVGRNLLIEITNWGNSNNNQSFTYPLDAGSAVATTMVNAPGAPLATSGTLNRNLGLVMSFLDNIKVTADYVSFGTGCKGSNGMPLLSSSGRPILNGMLAIDLSQARIKAPTILLGGLSYVQWGALALPYDLAAIGAPGCSLALSVDLPPVVAVTDAAGAASVKTTIPNAPVLAGMVFYHQFTVLEPTINALGLAFSNAGQALVGEL